MKTENKYINHTIVCGAGQSVISVIEELEKTRRMFATGADGTACPGNEYIVIDKSEEAIGRLLDRCGKFNYITGDPTEDEILIQAGIGNAFGIFIFMSSEKDNIYIAAAARQLNPSIRIVAAASDPFVSGKKLAKAGASSVISPNFTGGLRLVSEISRPSVTLFLDELLRGETDIHMREIIVTGGSSLNGKDIKTNDIHGLTGLLITAMRKNGKTGYIYNPPSSTIIQNGDTLAAFGTLEQLAKLQALAG
jgi:voltage-gated potassium channel